MKKRGKLIALIIVLAAALIAAGVVLKNTLDRQPKDIENIDEFIDESEESEEMPEFGSGIDFEEEADDAKLTFSASDESSYYGTWKATSDQAIYLYGKLELTINDDKTWSGTVVDEAESGTWTFDGTRMELKSEFFDVFLSFTEDGTMIMQEDREGSGEYINTVLTKQQ